MLIMVLVLDLRPPALPLLSLWSTWISYVVSYPFIAIVWANHHYLMRYAREVTPRLMWFNFAHVFSVSLLLSTAWMAVGEPAPQPVAFYAAVFFLVNATYIFLIRELIDRTPSKDIAPTARRNMRTRSIATLCLFTDRKFNVRPKSVEGQDAWVAADWMSGGGRWIAPIVV